MAGDDLAGNLANYKLQLQQVEAALASDSDNDDLMKLKTDLEEVIALTEDLVKNSRGESNQARSADTDEEDVDDVRAWLSSDFQAGDKCRAPWKDSSGETGLYPATVDEILDDGTCSVIFDRYGSTEIVSISSIKPPLAEGAAQETPRTKKDITKAQREYRKKKAQKKAQRLKQHEDEREDDKNKWLSFNSKIFSKTNKGKVKKSIFASPDLDAPTTGRVGIGTCGVSGRPMTKFQIHEKYKK